MPNIHLFTAADIEKLKQCARKLKRAEGIPHHLALERVAQAVKAPTWHHVVEAYKATDAVDQASDQDKAELLIISLGVMKTLRLIRIENKQFRP